MKPEIMRQDGIIHGGIKQRRIEQKLILASALETANIVRQGGVVAYPTESCYGLGCDPENHGALRRILQIKRRSKHKGLILIADHLCRLRRFLKPLPQEFTDEFLAGWPGPYTWVLPARQSVSRWLRGNHPTIAVRVSRHHQVKALCRAAGMAVVSTSANRSRRSILRSATAVDQQFGDEIDCIMEGSIGYASSPTVIRDGITGEYLRN
ncbi:L-threonylcarbamoyladenylate synthase [Candidatus Spongiihabitans sp.]|uniref:L-threonylcarbamoyladenylate synthase n=1 Tax=Candidatus Spongiihabitans sp. TaxID=3101308 RepID=UPI003C6FB55D